MKPTVASEMMQKLPYHNDYVQPPENMSLKSPLELLANACNKLETSMMSQSNMNSNKTPSSAVLFPHDNYPKRERSPPISPNSHIPLRTVPTRNPSEPLSLTKGSQSKSEQQPECKRPRLSPTVSQEQRRDSSTPKSEVTQQSLSEPISLVKNYKSNSSPVSPNSNMPQNLSKKDTPDFKETQAAQHLGSSVTKTEFPTLKVKTAESLSPAGLQNVTNNKRTTPSPRTANSRPSTSSPVLSHSPRPQHPSLLSSLATGVPPGVHYPPMPGFPPGYSQYMAMGGAPPCAPGAPGAPGAPCSDPLCRDPSCPTFALKLAQAQLLSQLGAAAAMQSMPLGYPYAMPPGFGGLGGLGGSIPGLPYGIPGGFPGAPPVTLPGMSATLPGMLPPSLMGLTTTSVPSMQPTQAITNAPITSSSSSPSLSGVGSSPYMCSWMQGRDFCGRRFNSSEELMSHLRSHTANMGADLSAPPTTAPPPASALAMLQAQAAQLRSQASPPRTSPATPTTDPRFHPYGRTSPTTPTTDPRFNPYGRPGGLNLPAGYPGSPLPPNPMLASLYGSPRPILPVLP